MANEVIVHSYASVNVGTSAYVTLIAATIIPVTEILVTDTSTKLLKIATGGTVVAAIAATGSLATTTPIVLTSVAAGTARNTNTFETLISAAAANPTNTVLATFAGSAAAITLTIVPNDGTNNGAVAVNLTTAQVSALINNGTVAGKSVTVTDGSSFRILQTSTGGDTTVVVNGGEGDGVTATFAGGVAATTTGEVDLFEVPVSGTILVPVALGQIPVGTRLAIKAIDASATTGYNVTTLLA